MSVQIKGSGTIGGIDEGLNITGVTTATNFKTGSSNLHSTGLTVGNNFFHTTGINVGTGATIHVPSSNVLTFGTNSAERLRIQSDGTLVTGAQTIPTSSDIGNIYIKNASAIGSPSHQINYVSNAVFNGSWKYITSGFGATQIIVNQSSISYGFAGSGTAGNNITFSEKLRITSGGNVYVGQTSGTEQLGVDGGSNSQTFSTNSTNSNGNMLQVKCSGTTKLFLGSAGSFVTGNTGTTNQGIRAEGDLLFAAGGHSERLRLTSTGQLLLNAVTGSSVALLKAGGSNTDLRVASVGTGGFFDVQTQGVDNRMRIDASGNFYTNQQRTKLAYGGPTACSLRWNITVGKNLSQNNSNRDNYGKINIQAGRANSTNVNDDCVAIRITPAEARSSTIGTKSCGIGFQHLNSDTYPAYSGNQAWMGLSLHSTPGQELSYLETWHNTQTSQGSQPNNVGLRIYPNGNVTAPSSAAFLAGGVNNYSGFPGNAVWKTYYTNTEYFDKGNNFDHTNGTFTAPADGAYFFHVSGLIYPMGENNFGQAKWVKNGSQYGQYMQFNGTGGNHRNFSYEIVMQMSTNDTCNFQIWRTSGQSWTLYNSQFNFGGFLIG